MGPVHGLISQNGWGFQERWIGTTLKHLKWAFQWCMTHLAIPHLQYLIFCVLSVGCKVKIPKKIKKFQKIMRFHNFLCFLIFCRILRSFSIIFLKQIFSSLRNYSRYVGRVYFCDFVSCRGEKVNHFTCVRGNRIRPWQGKKSCIIWILKNCHKTFKLFRFLKILFALNSPCQGPSKNAFKLGSADTYPWPVVGPTFKFVWKLRFFAFFCVFLRFFAFFCVAFFGVPTCVFRDALFH